MSNCIQFRVVVPIKNKSERYLNGYSKCPHRNPSQHACIYQYAFHIPTHDARYGIRCLCLFVSVFSPWFVARALRGRAFRTGIDLQAN